jgi:hypothetical protein
VPANTVRRSTTRQVDSGFFAVSQKSVYFAGAHKSMRVRSQQLFLSIIL